MEIGSAKESAHHIPWAPPLANTHHTAALWQQRDRKIQKVPTLLRQEERNSDAYDPKVVSFGPYHHGKQELQFCEEAKPFALQVFVEGSNQSHEFFYSKVLEVVADARSCYVEGSTDGYTDEQFAEMMLLDACFLIYYMNIGTQKPEHRVLMYNHLTLLVINLLNRDIFLLENQIPFPIVMLLINLRYENGQEEMSKFLHQSIWGEYKHERIREIQRQQSQNMPLHLFEAFRRVLVWDWIPQTQPKEFDMKKRPRNFRSAKDLRARGIHFKPSSNKSLKDKLPFLFLLWPARTPPLSNLFEFTVISYVNFMKLLIESPADVKELREKRILLTSLGSDEEVATLFTNMNTYELDSTCTLLEVKQRVQEHYDSMAKTWMAELTHTYLSSPWSFIAWLAAVLLLVLTFLQTYFTINPSD